MTFVYPLATIAVAGLSLILSSFFAFRSLSRSASADWVDQLEKRIELCESDRAQLHQENETMRREAGAARERERELLLRIVRLESA